jgi:hypothetical protein
MYVKVIKICKQWPMVGGVADKKILCESTYRFIYLIREAEESVEMTDVQESGMFATQFG